MNSALPATTPQFKAKLEALNGPFKGRSFKLISHQVYIGRSPTENDIVLEQDPYCSRQHAVVTQDTHSHLYFIEKLTKTSFVWVNNKKIQKKTKLKHHDTFTIGQTQFRFHKLKKAELVVASPASLQKPIQKSAPKKQLSSMLPKIIIGVIILFAIYLVIQNPGQNSSREDFTRMRTEQDITSDIQSVEELEKKSREEKQKLSGNQSYKNAQMAYLKGIRDYRKGFFGRARESFSVCKTLYPTHKLCIGYFKKATVKYQQLAQKQLVLGKEYKEKKQYHQCVAAFSNVIRMMKKYNKNNALYKEATANLKFCQLQIAERY